MLASLNIVTLVAYGVMGCLLVRVLALYAATWPLAQVRTTNGDFRRLVENCRDLNGFERIRNDFFQSRLPGVSYLDQIIKRPALASRFYAESCVAQLINEQLGGLHGPAVRLAALAPTLGLAGTIMGFTLAILRHGADGDALMAGVGLALVTTLIGTIVAAIARRVEMTLDELAFDLSTTAHLTGTLYNVVRHERSQQPAMTKTSNRESRSQPIYNEQRSEMLPMQQFPVLVKETQHDQ